MFIHHSALVPICVPRAYPEQLGESIHELYTEELRLPLRGDLRVTRTLDSEKAPHEWFSEMPLGDTWSYADLYPVFEYLYKCRHTRTIWRVESTNVVMLVILAFI